MIMGPFATQILGDLGADVVSVEDIGGDTNRVMGPGPHPQLSGTSLNLLRNKRNVSLDLKLPAGREAFLRLAETADMVVTNLRPGPLARLRLDYEHVRERRPDVVFCPAHGWPSDSPGAESPAYDDIVQAATGIADVLGPGQRQPCSCRASSPTRCRASRSPTPSSPRCTTATARARASTSRCPWSTPCAPSCSWSTGRPPCPSRRSARRLQPHPHAAPPAPADHRRFVNVLPYSQNHYEDLFTAGGRADLVGDDRIRGRARIANADSLYQDVAGVIATNTTSHWLAYCDEHGIPASKVVTLEELGPSCPSPIIRTPAPTGRPAARALRRHARQRAPPRATDRRARRRGAGRGRLHGRRSRRCASRARSAALTADPTCSGVSA